jgi:diguanylate cyclase (GGDEF)-like protein
MSSSKKTSASQKIARLKNAFVDKLPQQLVSINGLWAQLRDEPGNIEVLKQLHRTVHNLKGTGRTFGFSALGDAVAQCEELCNIRLSQTAEPDSDWSSQFEAGLEALEQQTNATISKAEQTTEQRIEPSNTVVPTVPCLPRDPHACLLYICDDDPLMLDHLLTQLSCFSYRAIGFTEIDKLKQSLSEQRADVLIMDINFPEGKNAGTDFIRQLRQEMDCRLPVLFLSSRDDFDARIAAVLAGGSGYFTKPADIQELIASLDGLTCQEEMESYRVMVVDDEPTVAEYHSVILQEAGMLTRCVNDPKIILKALHDFRPDLVLMDIYMPTCSGRDLATMIRQIQDFAALPIIYLSTETDKEKQFSAMRVGAEGFMTKPVVASELVAAVEIRAERMRSLRSLMGNDGLTGLFNHTTTTQLLETAMYNSQRYKTPLCFAMIDLDHFKNVNDSYGHPAGDQVLIAMARAMKQRFRGSDVVGRYGGEEFALILQNIAAEKASAIVNELREDFARLRFNVNQTPFSCTFSAGIATFPQYSTLETLRNAADQALYVAKKNGRNQVAIASGTPL